ncbi:hypothetical protein GCM10009127_26000 [Alteraurantiacibacter aestuarii]|uniref:glycosyltransferase family 8 protein n=1 Tax=Alteraurantiacibacter aestuarii TaxID=650004 RepID=UPI0031DF94BB
MKAQRLCLTTVSTDSYLVGTLVTLHSFLATNPWFDGDIVIITDGLTDESKRRLELVYPRLQYFIAGSELMDRVEDVARENPEFTQYKARFFSLEAFRLTGYGRVLLIDSDLLFRGSIEEMFAHTEPLVACGDGAWYKGVTRPWLPEGTPISSFNSGLVLADSTCVTQEHYLGLVNFVSAENYRLPHMKLADQIVLNIHFAGQATIIEPKFNYLLAHDEMIREEHGARMGDALVLHYNGRHKPWMMDQVVRNGLRQPAFVKACGLWYEAWTRCLTDMHMRARLAD